ncbi:hypothetical protein EII34_05840 [Arachnia propionica]|uniref:Uncharacterized protein n=1 Tax=Arachnia propionica TaxID=1750 RepID=A0A3P1T8C8_9ACTN|nr:hypothetical protein [Arachnia propionica]MDO5084703.1 hypothetical protein [Arachnia propionica]RRD05731.1 hypothetical protein EII34_05840 [Arachnia propionica]
MKENLVLLEGLTGEALEMSIGFALSGLIGLVYGWVSYTESTPHFVINYNGRSCQPLATLYGGGFMLTFGMVGLILEVDGLEAAIPDIILGLIALTSIPCMIIFLLGFFFWFPPFLLPPWYHRARKAGVPRNNPYAMGEFKALSVEQQKAAIQNRKRP